MTGSLEMTSGYVIGWNSDVGFSRGSAGNLYLGNGTAGDYTGALTASYYSAVVAGGGGVSLGAGDSSHSGYLSIQDTTNTQAAYIGYDTTPFNHLGVRFAGSGGRLIAHGDFQATGAIYDSTGAAGTSGQVLTSTVTGTMWAAGGGGGGIDLQTNGVDNGSQVKLNLIAGTNVTITDGGTGGVTIAASGGGGGGGLTQIAQQVVSGPSTTTITFSAIPGTYSSLILTGWGQTNHAAANDIINCTFNGDSGTNYNWSNIQGGSTVGPSQGGANNGVTAAFFGNLNGSSSGAIPGQFEAHISGYASTAFDKSYTSKNVLTITGGPYVQLTGGNWLSTAPITSITCVSATGAAFVAGTTFTLYGLQ
jgi:hypothetical protein